MFICYYMTEKPGQRFSTKLRPKLSVALLLTTKSKVTDSCLGLYSVLSVLSEIENVKGTNRKNFLNGTLADSFLPANVRIK